MKRMYCGNCRFYSLYFCSGCCANLDSRKYGEFVSKGDFCRLWDEKKKEKTDGGRA